MVLFRLFVVDQRRLDSYSQSIMGNLHVLHSSVDLSEVNISRISKLSNDETVRL